MTTIVRRKAPKSAEFSLRLLRQWGDAMLVRLGRTDAELSILLTNDTTIQQLNRDYRQKDRPTDVLSFHFDGGAGQPASEAEWLLGDIVISLDTAERQAKGRKRSLEAEVRWLLAHGILHLCGYDHATAEEKREMVAFTRRLVRAATAATPAATATTTRPRLARRARSSSAKATKKRS